MKKANTNTNNTNNTNNNTNNANKIGGITRAKAVEPVEAVEPAETVEPVEAAVEVIPLNLLNLSKAIVEYNNGVVLKLNALDMETLEKRLAAAVKDRQAEERDQYIDGLKRLFVESPVSAWEHYLLSPWYEFTVAVQDKDKPGMVKMGYKSKMLTLPEILEDFPQFAKLRKFEKHMKILWAMFIENGVENSDVANPLRVKYPETFRNIHSDFVEWSKEYPKTFDGIKFTESVSITKEETLLQLVVNEILPDGFELKMKKADVRNIRSAMTATTLATNGKSNIIIHNFNSCLVQLVDSMFHRFNNAPYEVQDKIKK